jgi:hypothetical protein
VSRRLRRYAWALTVRHIVFGLAIWYGHRIMQRSPSFRFLFSWSPWQVWAAVFGAVGMVSVYALRTHSDLLVRVTGGLAAAVSAAWASNFALSFVFDREQVSPLAIGLFAALAVKDYIILGVPMSAELDAILDRRVEGRAPDGSTGAR